MSDYEIDAADGDISDDEEDTIRLRRAVDQQIEECDIADAKLRRAREYPVKAHPRARPEKPPGMPSMMPRPIPIVPLATTRAQRIGSASSSQVPIGLRIHPIASSPLVPTQPVFPPPQVPIDSQPLVPTQPLFPPPQVPIDSQPQVPIGSHSHGLRSLRHPRLQMGSHPQLQIGSMPQLQTDSYPQLRIVPRQPEPRPPPFPPPQVPSGSQPQVPIGSHSHVPRLQLGSHTPLQIGSHPQLQTNSYPQLQIGGHTARPPLQIGAHTARPPLQIGAHTAQPTVPQTSESSATRPRGTKRRGGVREAAKRESMASSPAVASALARLHALAMTSLTNYQDGISASDDNLLRATFGRPSLDCMYAEARAIHHG
jgi:hypothetical protein